MQATLSAITCKSCNFRQAVATITAYYLLMTLLDGFGTDWLVLVQVWFTQVGCYIFFMTWYNSVIGTSGFRSVNITDLINKWHNLAELFLH